MAPASLAHSMRRCSCRGVEARSARPNLQQGSQHQAWLLHIQVCLAGWRESRPAGAAATSQAGLAQTLPCILCISGFRVSILNCSWPLLGRPRRAASEPPCGPRPPCSPQRLWLLWDAQLARQAGRRRAYGSWWCSCSTPATGARPGVLLVLQFAPAWGCCNGRCAPGSTRCSRRRCRACVARLAHLWRPPALSPHPYSVPLALTCTVRRSALLPLLEQLRGLSQLRLTHAAQLGEGGMDWPCRSPGCEYVWDGFPHPLQSFQGHAALCRVPGMVPPSADELARFVQSAAAALPLRSLGGNSGRHAIEAAAMQAVRRHPAAALGVRFLDWLESDSPYLRWVPDSEWAAAYDVAFQYLHTRHTASEAKRTHRPTRTRGGTWRGAGRSCSWACATARLRTWPPPPRPVVCWRCGAVAAQSARCRCHTGSCGSSPSVASGLGPLGRCPAAGAPQMCSTGMACRWCVGRAGVSFCVAARSPRQPSISAAPAAPPPAVVVPDVDVHAERGCACAD